MFLSLIRRLRKSKSRT